MDQTRKKGRRLLASFFATYFVVLIIPVTLALLYYQESLRIVQNDIEMENRALLTQAGETLDARVNEIRSIGSQLIRSSQAMNLWYVEDPFDAKNVGKVIAARDSMTKYLVSNDFIFDYLLFFNRGQFVLNDQSVYSYDEFYKLYMRPDGMEYDQWLAGALTEEYAFGECQARSVHYMNGDVPQQLDLVEFSYSFLPYQSGNGRAVIYVRQDRLLELLSGLNLESGSLLIENSLGEPLAARLSEGTDIALLQQALGDMTEDYSSRSCRLGGEKMLLIQAKSPEAGFRIAVALPEAMVNARLTSLHAIIWGTLVAAILLGGLLCYHLSKRNTTLLHAIVRDDGDRLLQMSYGNALRSLQFSFADIQSANEAMTQTLEEQKPYLRYTFINRLINGDFRSESEALVLAKTVCEGEEMGVLRVVLFRFNAGADSGDTLSLQMLTNAKAAVKLAVESTLPGALYIDKSEEEFVLLAQGDSTEEEMRALVSGIRQKLPESIQSMLFIYAGNAVDQLTDVVRSYDNAASLIYIQPAPEVTPVVFFDQVSSHKQALFYPQDIQHHLVQCTMNGDEEGLTNLLGTLKERNLSQAQLPAFMHQLLVDNLLNTLLQATNMASLAPEATEAICDSIRELMGMPLGVQIQQVDQLFLRLCQEVRNLKSGKQQNLIEQVMGYIQTNYADSDLSLTQVADHFHVSESYLSYTFKIQSGVNFVSFVENLRMTKAKELLRQTSLKIGDIALQVGYASTNSFCRAFKRSTGDSASSYRNGGEGSEGGE